MPSQTFIDAVSVNVTAAVLPGPGVTLGPVPGPAERGVPVAEPGSNRRNVSAPAESWFATNTDPSPAALIARPRLTTVGSIAVTGVTIVGSDVASRVNVVWLPVTMIEPPP